MISKATAEAAARAAAIAAAAATAAAAGEATVVDALGAHHVVSGSLSVLLELVDGLLHAPNLPHNMPMSRSNGLMFRTHTHRSRGGG